jgi:TP901 family phage tail tape measure protein
MASKFSLEAILSLTDNLTRPYKNTSNKITAINKGLTGSFGRLNDGINKTIGFIGRGIQRGAQIGLGAIAVGVTAAALSFVQLDDSITNAGAKFKDLSSTSLTFGDSLKELSTSARAVGADTEFSAVDAAGALDKFAMAGMNSSQAMVLLRGTTDLATAAGTDLTTAVDIATDSLGAFNLVTEDTAQLQENLARVSDVMAKTTTTANTSLIDMFESVKAGAPAFTAAGQQIEDFAALTGVMANSGVKGSTAGTNLRNIMLRLAKPTAEAQKVLEGLGVTTQDSAGNFRNVIDILGDFEKGLEGMGTAQRTAELATVFGARAVTGVNILLAEGADKLAIYRDSLIDSAGASRTMAEAIRGSLGNRIKVLKSGLTELGLQFIDAFDTQGRNALDGIIKSIQNFDMNIIIDAVNKTVETFMKLGRFIMDHKGFIESLVIAMVSFKLAVIAVNAAMAIQMGLMAAGPVLSMIKVFMSLAKTEGILATAQYALNTAMAANPIGLIIIGVTALIAVIILMVKHWDSVGPVLAAVGKGFMTFILAPINLVIDAIGSLLMIVSKIPGVGNKLQPAIDALGSFQDKMNKVTFSTGFIAQTNENQQMSEAGKMDSNTMAVHEIEREKSERNLEIKQRYDINLNAPPGYSMGAEGETPTTSVKLGVQ